MATPLAILLIVLGGILALFVGVVVLVYIIVPLCTGIGMLIRHIFRFVAGMITDALRAVGAIVTTVLFIPLVIGSIIIGRWSAAAHFGRSVQSECVIFGTCLYRLAVGHPFRLLGLRAVTDGIERRIPEAMAAAPGRDTPSKRTGKFEGYTIVGSLAGGGSGAKLYIAEPDEVKRAALERASSDEIDQVVIKSFSLHDGSSLPQILRESRSLEPAKKLGLILDYEQSDERFFYVMRYVPGESLTAVTHALHDQAPSGGLDDRRLRRALGYVGDLLETLEVYHRGGLWHKDVKPDNIIVHRDEAHLVDLGLVTPLRSAMTLTTHGTEYFRDPEMVRMALKGTKVHQVDGTKFDIFAAGAVLYAVIENSFPAHGGLSQITRRCPDTLRWVIRRAMTDYDKRYASVTDMLADLRVIANADDPFKLKPVDLPSMSGGSVELPELPEVEAEPIAVKRRAASPVPPVAPAAPIGRRPQPETGERRRPRLAVTNWWTGGYNVEGHEEARAKRQARKAPPARPAPHVPPVRPARPAAPRPVTPPGGRRPASEQLASARARARDARTRARDRMKSHARSRHQHTRYQNTMNPGIAIAVVGFIGTALILAGLFLVPALSLKKSSEQVVIPETPWAELQQKIEALNRAGASSEEMHRVLTDILKNDESLRRALIDSLPESLEIDGQGLRSRANEVKDVVTMPLRKMFPPTPDVRDTVQRGTILVVSDFRPPLDANVASELEYAYQRLSHLGYKLVGDVSLRHADRASDAYAEQDELVALARHEKGINRIDSPETCRTLQGWMNDHDSIKHVLWLSPSGDDTLLQYAAIGPTIVYADAPVKVSGDGETAVKIVNAVAQSSRSKR